jgi:dihydropteroate synthase
VDAAEQVKRVVPVIERLRASSDVPISIDTTCAAVARAAIAAGADVINDVSAGVEDPEILAVAAASESAIILMHRRAAPSQEHYSDQYESPPIYEDIVKDVANALAERARVAEATGIERAKIVLDPGFGFGKSVEQNLELLGRINEIAALGYPVLAGLSRKSFVGAVYGIEEPSARMAGSVAMALQAWEGGATILRVHEPGPHRQALLATETKPATIPVPNGP